MILETIIFAVQVYWWALLDRYNSLKLHKVAESTCLVKVVV